jgi:hypothetical protein
VVRQLIRDGQLAVGLEGEHRCGGELLRDGPHVERSIAVDTPGSSSIGQTVCALDQQLATSSDPDDPREPIPFDHGEIAPNLAGGTTPGCGLVSRGRMMGSGHRHAGYADSSRENRDRRDRPSSREPESLLHQRSFDSRMTSPSPAIDVRRPPAARLRLVDRMPRASTAARASRLGSTGRSDGRSVCRGRDGNEAEKGSGIGGHRGRWSERAPAPRSTPSCLPNGRPRRVPSISVLPGGTRRSSRVAALRARRPEPGTSAQARFPCGAYSRGQPRRFRLPGAVPRPTAGR